MVHSTACVAVVALFCAWLLPAPSPSRVRLPHYLRSGSPDHFTEVPINNTLGFQKAYVLSLRARHDRHDEFSLLSSAYRLEIERLDGVLHSDMRPEGQPLFDDDVTATEKACWRAHVRIWRKMVEEKIESALILEDDADFDVNLKESLQRLQRPLHTLFDSVQTHHQAPLPSTASPWMHSEWDMIYLGACMEYPIAQNQLDPSTPLSTFGGQPLNGHHAPYVVYHDPTVADLTDSKMPETLNFYAALGLELPERIAGYGDPKYDLPGYTSTVKAEDRVRVVGKTHSPWCLTSYALTYRGALRLLYHSTRHVEDAVDWQTIKASSIGWINSYTVYPPLFDQFKMVNSSWNSDINANAIVNLDRRGRRWNASKGRAKHIRRSARRELGQRTEEQ
ncbi:unnamed protein product [Parajaminaea phylloscopi]